jgi:hypothetical protein
MSSCDKIITANSLNEAILKLQTLLPIQVINHCSKTGNKEVVYTLPQVFGYDISFDSSDEVCSFLNSKIESSNMVHNNICYHVCKLYDNKYIYKTNEQPMINID